MNEGSDSPRYEVNIEDQIHPWSKGTISVAEIRQLGGFPPDAQVAVVDLADNSGEIMPDDAVHDVTALEPGKPLVKRMSFRRA
jgi:hypothetical protein